MSKRRVPGDEQDEVAEIAAPETPEQRFGAVLRSEIACLTHKTTRARMSESRAK